MVRRPAPSPSQTQASGEAELWDKTIIESTGFPDLCLWNPMGDEKMGWDNYVCVEPVLVDATAIPVGRFKETLLTMRIACEKL